MAKATSSKVKGSKQKVAALKNATLTDYFLKQGDTDKSSGPSITRPSGKKVTVEVPSRAKSKSSKVQRQSSPTSNGDTALQVRRSPRQKAHVESLEAEKPIPSSQSEEEELAMDCRNHVSGPAAGPSTTAEPLNNMEVDTIPRDGDTRASSPLTSLSPSRLATPDPSPLENRSNILVPPPPLTSEHSLSERAVTPPLSSPPKAHDATPVALDRRTKAEMIITRLKHEAEIRAAEALRKEKENRIVDIPDELSDSSEEEDFMTNFRRKQAGASKAASPTPRSGDHTSSSRRIVSAPSGHNLPVLSSSRNVSSPLSPTPANRPSRTHKQPARRPEPLATQPEARPKKAINPLDALLKEKRAGERKGAGESAFLLAEKHERELRTSEAPEDDEALHDAEAAQRAAQAGMAMRVAKGMSYDGETFDDVIVTAETRNQILGQEAGEAVGRILQQDLHEKVEEERKCGLDIFTSFTADLDHMDTDETLPSWESFDGEHPHFVLIREALQTNDAARVSKAFRFIPGLESVGRHANLSVMRVFCQLATMAWESSISTRAGWLVSRWAALAPAKDVWPITVHYVANVLVRQGMRQEFLARIVPADMSSTRVSHVDQHEAVLHSLLEQIVAFATMGCVDEQEIPGVALAMLFIAMSSTSMPDVRARAEDAFHYLVGLLAQDRASEVEVIVAQKTLAFANSLSPENQRYLTSFFVVGGSKSALRISRRVAYHLITGLPFNPATYAELPPLDPIISAIERGPLFMISKDTDYNALSEHVRVLATALSGIEEYVASEASEMGRKTSTDAMRRSSSTLLERVLQCLMSLHGRILDTQAAHLDRTHAKGWIQLLHLRVHYQRESVKSDFMPTRRKGPQRIDEMLIRSPQAQKGVT